MARHIPKRDGGLETAGSPTPENPNPEMGMNGTVVERAGSGQVGSVPLPGPRGGSYGVMPEAIQRVQQGAVREPQQDPKRGKQARRYRLTKDWRVVINGQVIPTKEGKVYLDTAYDIGNLQAQGVPLECLDPEPEPEPIPTPEPADDELAADQATA